MTEIRIERPHINKIEVTGNSPCVFLQNWLPLRLIYGVK